MPTIHDAHAAAPPHSHAPLKVGSPKQELDAVPAGLWLAGEATAASSTDTAGRATSPTTETEAKPPSPSHCTHDAARRPPMAPIMTRSSNSSTSSRGSPTTPPSYMPTPPLASLRPLPDPTTAHYEPFPAREPQETTPLFAAHTRTDSRHAHSAARYVHWGGDVEARAVLSSARELEIVLRARERAVGRATVRFWRTLFIALAVAAMLGIVVLCVAVTNAPPPPSGPPPYPMPGPDRPV